MEDLEKKLEKPDWKQWLPVYGIYQVSKDFKKGRPSIIDGGREENPVKFVGSAIYQGASVAFLSVGALLALGYGCYHLAEKLF